MNDPATTPTVRVRPARPADAEAIWRLHVRSIRETCAADYPPEQIEAWAGPKRPEDYVRAVAGGERIWVAEGAAGLLGFACLAGERVRGLYVSPDAQRRGVGRLLMNELELDAARRGVVTLALNATLNARAFYAARGYTAGERIVRQMGGVDVPCVPMTKVLPPPP
jgi:putative acetyltransferase